VDWIAGSAWRYFTLIFLLSVATCVYQLNQVNRRYLVPTDDRELGAIAISLMKTGGFANTYMIPTGPTAHLPPVSPLIDSLIYKALGLTSRAGYVRALFIIITASVLYGMLPWGSTPVSRTHPKRLIMGLEECHAKTKEVFRGVQARSGCDGQSTWGHEGSDRPRAGHQSQYDYSLGP
jgi:hypothetical protein